MRNEVYHRDAYRGRLLYLLMVNLSSEMTLRLNLLVLCNLLGGWYWRLSLNLRLLNRLI